MSTPTGQNPPPALKKKSGIAGPGFSRRRARLATFVVVVLACAGGAYLTRGTWSREPAGGAPAVQTPPKLAPGLVALPTTRRVDVRLAEEYAVATDPVKDGWETEAFYEVAKAQLKDIGKLLAHPEELNAAHLAKVATPDVTCGPLRPEVLSEVYRDKAITVSRPPGAPTGGADADPPSSYPSDYQGYDGLAAALKQLLRPMPDAKDVMLDFKFSRVEAGADSTDTTAFVYLSGRTESGAVQQNALWHCRWSKPAGPTDPPLLRAIRVDDYEQVTTRTSAPGGRLFADWTEAVLAKNPCYREQLVYGMDHWRNRMEARLGVYLGGSDAVTVGDVNGDGLEDVYLCQPGGLPNRLFRANPDGTATDIAAEAGVDVMDPGFSALLLDFDNDGDQDLALVVGYHKVVIFANDGNARFTQAAFVSGEGFTYSLCAADYDNDGDVDLYVCRYSHVAEIGESHGRGNPSPIYDANNGAPDSLYRNEGGLKFTDVTKEVGLDRQNNTRFGLAAAWEDFDNDGDVDLAVANDFGRKNLYRNDAALGGGRRFVDVAPQAGVEDTGAGMGVTWGDYDNDGWMDLYFANMFSSAGHRVAFQPKYLGGPAARGAEVKERLQRFARGNSLFRNAGDGTFRDTSYPMAVTMGRWGWSTNFVDLNNDGWQDVFCANGFITGELADDL